MKTTHEFISKVYELIKDPNKFTSNWFARDQNGKSVSWNDPAAVRFDLLGAIEKIGTDAPSLKEEVLREFRDKIPLEYGPLYKFAERGGHEQVVLFLNKILSSQLSVDSEKPTVTESEITVNIPLVQKRRGRPKGKNRSKT